MAGVGKGECKRVYSLNHGLTGFFYHLFPFLCVASAAFRAYALPLRRICLPVLCFGLLLGCMPCLNSPINYIFRSLTKTFRGWGPSLHLGPWLSLALINMFLRFGQPCLQINVPLHQSGRSVSNAYIYCGRKHSALFVMGTPNT